MKSSPEVRTIRSQQDLYLNMLDRRKITKPCEHGNESDDCFYCRQRRHEEELGAELVKNPQPTTLPVPLVGLVPRLTQAAQELQNARMIASTKVMLGITLEEEREKKIEPLRRFYQPLGQNRPREWPKELGGMSAENVAMFLTMPEVLYLDYEKNKNNPPKTIFLTPAEAFDHPSSKGRGGVRPEIRSTEWGVPHIGTEIVVLEESRIICTEPGIAKERRGKLPVPAELLKDLAAAEGMLELLKARYAAGSVPLFGKKLVAAKRKAYRNIEKIEYQIASYRGRGRWGKVEIPGTVRPSVEIEIKPCPTGSSTFFSMTMVENYIRCAWGTKPKDDMFWDWAHAAFENEVIKRAIEVGVFSRFPRSAEAYAHELLAPDDSPLDTTAQDNAKCGYRRRPDGSAPDESIRRVGPRRGPGDRKFGSKDDPVE